MMDALTLRGFLLIAAAVTLVFETALGVYVLVDELEPLQILVFSLGGVTLGLVVAGCCYLVQVTKDIRNLHLPPCEVLPSEAVVKESRPLVHYRTGRPHRFWEAVGGKFVLTTRRLVFITHRGQPWCYKLSIPLDEITYVDDDTILGVAPGALRVNRADGKKELFTFGAVRKPEADEWVVAIRMTQSQQGVRDETAIPDEPDARFQSKRFRNA
jgi:hypothetical protein